MTFRGPCIVIHSEDRASWYIQRTVHRDTFRGPCIVTHSEDRASWRFQRTVHRDTFRRPCIVIHSEDRASWYIRTMEVNKMHYFSTLFWKTTLHVSDTLSIIRSLNSVLTAIGIRDTNYVNCLLVRWGWISLSHSQNN